MLPFIAGVLPSSTSATAMPLAASAAFAGSSHQRVYDISQGKKAFVNRDSFFKPRPFCFCLFLSFCPCQIYEVELRAQRLWASRTTTAALVVIVVLVSIG